MLYEIQNEISVAEFLVFRALRMTARCVQKFRISASVRDSIFLPDDSGIWRLPNQTSSYHTYYLIPVTITEVNNAMRSSSIYNHEYDWTTTGVAMQCVQYLKMVLESTSP